MRLVLALLLVAPAAAFADAAKEPLHGDVLVWQDARLLVDPADPASAFQIGTAPRTLGQAFAMRVVGTKDDLVEVEPEPSTGCVTATMSAASIARAHVFVARADLAPVLAKPFRATFPDGSRVDLRAGTAVQPGDGGTVRAGFGEHVLDLAIPASSIAHSYAPAPVSSPPVYKTGATIYATTQGTAAAIAGTTWSSPQLVLETDRATKQGDRTLLDITERCATLTFNVAADQVHTIKQPYFGSLAGVAAGSPPPPIAYVPKGTPLATPAGRRVGSAAEDVTMSLEPDGKLACADFAFALDRPPSISSKPAPAKVHLCAPAKAFRYRKGYEPRQQLQVAPKN